MDNLKELVDVVNRNKVKSIRILDNSKKNDRLVDFYKKICSGDLKNDDEAAQFFFKTDRKNTQYRKLKSRLRDLLFNTAFFIDVNNPKFSNAQKAFYQCQKDLITVQILLGRYARNTAIEHAKRTLRQAKKFEFTEICLELCKKLRENCAFRIGNFSDFKFYDDEVLKYQAILVAEDKAARCLQKIALAKVRSSVSLQKAISDSAKFLEELDATPDMFRSFRFNFSRYSLMIDYALNIRDHELLLQTCEEAIGNFSAKPTTPIQFLGQFYYFKLLAFTQLGKFNKGLAAAEESFAIFEIGTVGWFNTMELYFIHLVKYRKYTEASKLVSQVNLLKNLQYQSQKIQEIWRKYGAYTFYLEKIGKINTARKSKFRLPKFLNEVPVFSMDKQGYNIPILIIQILVLIQDRKFDVLTDRMDAIEKYSKRHLRKDENIRSNCFIKMLLQIPRRHFHRAAVIRHSAKYLKILTENSPSLTKQAFDVEIIPYEHLWEYALESLDNKFY